MSLNDELSAPPFERRADVGAQIGVRRVDVDEIDAADDGEIEIGLHLLGRFVHEAFAAERYDAHTEPRASQYSVFHRC